MKHTTFSPTVVERGQRTNNKRHPKQGHRTVSVKVQKLHFTCSGNLQTLYESGNKKCYASLNLIYVFLGHVTSIISGPTIFDFLTSILIIFTTKSYLRSETHI